MLGFLLIISTKGLHILRKKGWITFGSRWFKVSAGSFLVVNVLFLLYVSLRPADHHVNMYETIYEHSATRDTMYYVEENPYNRAKEISFYRRNDLAVRELDSAKSEIKQKRGQPEMLLIAYKGNEYPAFLERSGKLLYSSYPRWVLDIEFNDWKEWTHICYLVLVDQERALKIAGKV